MPRFLVTLTTLGGLLTATAAAAEPFAIDLEVRSGKASKTAHAESAARGTRSKDREVLDVKTGDRLTVRWKLSSTDSKATVKNVTVHFYAVSEEKAGQQVVPPLDKGVWAESALGMDFGPKDKSEGALSFTIDRPGCYLFRLETIGATSGRAGHENFAALDVTVR